MVLSRHLSRVDPLNSAEPAINTSRGHKLHDVHQLLLANGTHSIMISQVSSNFNCIASPHGEQSLAAVQVASVHMFAL